MPRRKSRLQDIRLPDPKYMPSPRTILFEYELGEDNLRMLHTLQQRGRYTSLSAALRECLGIVTTLVRETEDGYAVLLSRNGEVKACDIETLEPQTSPENLFIDSSDRTVAVVVNKELEAKEGYSPERARDLPLHLYPEVPVPDGEWIGALDYKVRYPDPASGKALMKCCFTFIREISITGENRGSCGAKYRLKTWKRDGGIFAPHDSMIDFGSLDVEPGMRFRIGTRTGRKATGAIDGFWNSAHPEGATPQQEELAKLLERGGLSEPSESGRAAPVAEEEQPLEAEDPLVISNGDLADIVHNEQPPAFGEEAQNRAEGEYASDTEE